MTDAISLSHHKWYIHECVDLYSNKTLQSAEEPSGSTCQTPALNSIVLKPILDYLRL